MSYNELKEVISQSKRYKEFALFDNFETVFSEFFKDKSFDCVQVHSTDLYEVDGKLHIVGFAGQFVWKDNKLTSLDGDSYNPDMHILGYKYFNLNKKEGEEGTGLDILVGNDW